MRPALCLNSDGRTSQRLEPDPRWHEPVEALRLKVGRRRGLYTIRAPPVATSGLDREVGEPHSSSSSSRGRTPRQGRAFPRGLNSRGGSPNNTKTQEVLNKPSRWVIPTSEGAGPPTAETRTGRHGGVTVGLGCLRHGGRNEDQKGIFRIAQSVRPPRTQVKQGIAIPGASREPVAQRRSAGLREKT